MISSLDAFQPIFLISFMLPYFIVIPEVSLEFKVCNAS
jgi:hypothetical protein